MSIPTVVITGASAGVGRATSIEFARRGWNVGLIAHGLERLERHAVGRHPASGPIGESDRVRIPLSEEQVDVEKRTVATEEVTVGKRVREDEEHVDATIRKEDIKVDKRGRSDTRP